MKTAIVYDWIDSWGGVERLILQLFELFPHAHLYTSYVDHHKAFWLKNIPIHTSFIQRLPNFIKKNRVLSFSFYPYAFESFNFDEYDMVISITSSFAKSIVTKPETLHICYLLTPTRYLWLYPEYYFNSITKLCVSPFFSSLKQCDFVMAQRPDHIISISNAVKERCNKYYKRESEVIYPGFDTEYWKKVESQKSKVKSTAQNLKFKIIEKQKYYLLVSRLEPYKMVQLAVETFNKLPELKLVIVGQGKQRKKLERVAGKNVIFANYVSDEELSLLYSHAEALIMPQIEDFGYVSLEAQYFGCPVIAYDKGGVFETILDGKTGILFNKQDVVSLTSAIERFQSISYNMRTNTKELGRKNVERFSKQIFKEKINRYINSKFNTSSFLRKQESI